MAANAQCCARQILLPRTTRPVPPEGDSQFGKAVAGTGSKHPQRRPDTAPHCRCPIQSASANPPVHRADRAMSGSRWNCTMSGGAALPVANQIVQIEQSLPVFNHVHHLARYQPAWLASASAHISPLWSVLLARASSASTARAQSMPGNALNVRACARSN